MARRPLIAIVEDDESHLRSLANLLRSLQYRVEGFTSADAFVHASASGHVDCVIVDVRMPGMDGLHLARELAAARRRIPIVFVSGCADEGVRDEAARVGAIAFLAKPCREADLVAALTAALNTSTVRRGEAMATITTNDGTRLNIGAGIAEGKIGLNYRFNQPIAASY